MADDLDPAARPDTPTPPAEDREALVDHMVVALRTAWQDDYSAQTVAEGVADAALAWFAASQPAPVDAETTEVAAERARAVSLGYDERHDDKHGAYSLAEFAQGYLLRGVQQGNRSDFIKAAGLLLNAAASFRRLGQPLGAQEVPRG